MRRRCERGPTLGISTDVGPPGAGGRWVVTDANGGGGVTLRRLVTWSYDRRRWVVALWLAAVVAASVLAGVPGGDSDVDSGRRRRR